MNDPFKTHVPGLESPAANAAAVTPSDTADLPDVTRAIYVGNGGSLTVETVGGDVVTLQNVQSGMVYPLRLRKVRTGTTATGLIGLW